jgi:hypothetical protein
MKLNRKELVAALEFVMPGVSTSSFISGSDLVTFKDGGIYSTSGVISMMALYDTPEELEVAVNASELLSVMKRFDVAEVDVKVGEDKLIIKAGKAKATLAIAPVIKNSPLYFEDRTLIPLPSDYFDAIVNSHIAGNKHKLAGAYFEGKEAMSTDGKRINYTELTTDTMKFWINDASCKALIKCGHIFPAYAVTPSHVWFSSSIGTVAIARLNDEGYQADAVRTYYGHCKESKVDTIDIPAGLYEAVQRAAPFTEVIESLQPVQLAITPEGIQVTVEQGKDSYEELIEFEEELSIEPETIKVDYSHLLYGLKRCNRMGVATIGEGKMLVLYSVNSTLMLATL